MDIKSELPACEVCGCTSYSKISGYYVCASCDTQSQEIEERLFDYNENQRINEDEEREEIVSKDGIKVRPPTSWESYNFILKGLTQELIELGASPQLRIVAFQIWASYLQRASIAFYSKQPEKLPLLPMGFKSSDAKILYGVPNLRKSIYKGILFKKQAKRVANLQEEISDIDTSSASSLKSNTSLRSIRIKQRKVAVSELDSSASHESLSSHSEDLQSLGSSKSKSKKRLKIGFKSSTQKAIKQLLDTVKRSKKFKTENKEKKIKDLVKRRIHERKRNTNVDNNMLVSLTTVISVIRIALLLLGDEILLGDLLRWMCEGRLSVNQVEKFIPESRCPNRNKFEVVPCCRNGSETDIRNCAAMLGIRDIPSPDLYKLAKRFCEDLCLPNEFLGYVHGLMNMLEPKMNYADYDFHGFPNYECRILAYILMSFKLLFSLDGLTEVKQSLFADYVNKDLLERPGPPTLFSWSSWVRYIECRNALLSKYDPYVNEHAYKGRIYNRDTYEHNWEKLNPTYGIHTDIIDPVFMSSTDYVLKKTLSEPSKNIEFPASLTPHISNLQHLLSKHSSLIPENSLPILNENFAYHSLQHLLNPEMCEAIATHCNVNVEFVDGIAAVDMEPFKPTEPNVPVISKTGVVPAYVPVYVDVVNIPRKSNKGVTRFEDCKKFNFDFETFAEPEPSPNIDTFKIYQPFKEYWFFHHFHSHTNNVDFYQIAKETLSDSFLWLLKELAHMVHTDVKDLYAELQITESVLYSLFVQGEYVGQGAVRLNPNEW